MADFCKQCSEAIFGEDFGDLADIAPLNGFLHTICEGCGDAIVDREGRCHAGNCIAKHGSMSGTLECDV